MSSSSSSSPPPQEASDLKARISNAIQSLDTLSEVSKKRPSLKRSRIEALVDAEAGADQSVSYLSDDVLARCRPWSREDLQARAATFEVSQWFLKDASLSPLHCARFGWVREGPANSILCRWCKASIQAPAGAMKPNELEDMQKKLSSSHSSECAWQSSECSVDLARIDREAVLSLHSGWNRLVHRACGIRDALSQHDASLPTMGRTELRFDPSFVEELVDVLIRHGSRSSDSMELLRMMATFLSLLKDKTTSTGELIVHVNDLIDGATTRYASVERTMSAGATDIASPQAARVRLLDQEIDSETVRTLLRDRELIPFVLALFGLSLKVDGKSLTLSCETCGSAHNLLRAPRGPSYKRRSTQRPTTTLNIASLSGAAQTAMAAAMRAAATFSKSAAAVEKQTNSLASSSSVIAYDEITPSEETHEEKEEEEKLGSEFIDPLYSHKWYCPMVRPSEAMDHRGSSAEPCHSPLRLRDSTIQSVSHGLASISAATFGVTGLDAISRLLIPREKEGVEHSVSSLSNDVSSEGDGKRRGGVVSGWVSVLVTLLCN